MEERINKKRVEGEKRPLVESNALLNVKISSSCFSLVFFYLKLQRDMNQKKIEGKSFSLLSFISFSYDFLVIFLKDVGFTVVDCLLNSIKFAHLLF